MNLDRSQDRRVRQFVEGEAGERLMEMRQSSLEGFEETPMLADHYAEKLPRNCTRNRGIPKEPDMDEQGYRFGVGVLVVASLVIAIILVMFFGAAAKLLCPAIRSHHSL